MQCHVCDWSELILYDDQLLLSRLVSCCAFQGQDGGGRHRPQHGEEEAREAAVTAHPPPAGPGRRPEPVAGCEFTCQLAYCRLPEHFVMNAPLRNSKKFLRPCWKRTFDGPCTGSCKRNVSLFENSRPSAARQCGLPMHIQSANFGKFKLYSLNNWRHFFCSTLYVFIQLALTFAN